ncbi:DUF4493 domain-containing protein [Marivirga arenosa]|uniref:DUF4493 domain-containing protein n=1 Tax=Marivirga arenosa TaxID=3059076 RepID=A0AA49GFD6_9BACT|nr:DUF4493 domain-containing protein [Marivirga sp. ABR2-2]WKK84314.2 DUF4493 domain-containing protein [Marivirga sp. ABR2-2]
MKTISSYLAIVFLATFLSCNEELTDPESEKEIGFLSLALNLDIDIQKTNRQLSVNTDDFKVIIYDELDNEVSSFERFADMPAQVELPEGNYYVVVHSNNLLPAAFDNPYYYGTSSLFTINKGEVEEVIVTSELANVKVSVAYSDSVLTNFDDWETEVALGSDALIFVKDETRSGYFEVGPLTINATLYFTKSDGTTDSRTVSGTIDNPQPKDHYTITIDATLEAGSSSFTIEVDDSTNDIDVTFTNSENQCFIEGQFTGVRYIEYEDPDEENEYKLYYDETTGNVIGLLEQESAPPYFEVNLTYNGNDQVIRAESIDGAYEYFYDGSGRISEYLYYDNLGAGNFELNGRIVNTYTGTQLTKSQFYNNDGSGNYTVPGSYHTYIYPNTTTNDPEQVNSHQSSGLVTERSFYTYDSNPNPYRMVGGFFYFYIDVPGMDFSDHNVVSIVQEEWDAVAGAFVADESSTISYTYNAEGYPTEGSVVQNAEEIIAIFYNYCSL